MALTYGNIETLVREKYIPVLADNIFDSSYRLKKMKENPMHILDGGRKIMVPILYAKGRGGAYAERGLLNINPKQTKTMAAYDWKYLYASINISKQEEDQVRGEPEILNLIQTEMQLAEKTLIDELSTASYNDGSDDLYPHGARKIFSYDRSLGGIDSTTYTWWDSNHCVAVDSNYSTTNLTKANFTDPSSNYYMPTVMNKVWMNCIHNGDKPTAVYASQGMYEVYESVLQPFQSFQRNYTGAVKEAADAGFQVLEYHGVPFIYDEYCPTSHIFFDSPKYNGIAMLSADQFKMGKFQKPVNQEVSIAKITLSCQFITNNPRMLGVIVGASAIG
jgi:hypothetical protein